MLIDFNAQFCDADTITATVANAIVGDVYDTGAAPTTKNLDCAKPMYLVVSIDEAVTSAGDATVEFTLLSDSTADLATSATTHWRSGDIPKATLALGYKLVALVDKAQGNPLTQRIRGVRQVISDGNGVLLPEIRIRENFRLKPSQYAIFINGIKADEADIPADKLMALPSSETYGEIDGVLGNDPAYGMPVTWIQPAQKAKALNMGYQVIDSASVIATHVNKIVRSYIPDLFNYDDITQLHNRLASMAPRLAEDLSAVLNYSQLLKVYRALLTEGVSLRDIVTIATVLVASSAVTKDHILLAADVRLALRRSITHPFVRKQELTVYTLNNELENLLTNVVNQAQQSGKVMLDSVPVDPNMLNQFQSTMPQVKEQMKAAGKDPVLLVPPQLRPLLARYARLFAPGLHVLSYNEVPDELELKIMGALS